MRVIADVHGELDLLRSALEGADRFVFLGDLVDRGPDSAGVLRLALDLIEAGKAQLVRSNHDDKLMRALLGRRVTVSSDLQHTLAQLQEAEDGADLTRRFLSAFKDAPFYIAEAAYILAHGAVHPQLWQEKDAAAFETPQPSARRFALYGEVNGSLKPDGKPRRFYDWVDLIPPGRTAIVGHDRRSGSQPLIQPGALGGRAIFIDTGAGRGGPLTFIDLPGETVGQVLPAGGNPA